MDKETIKSIKNIQSDINLVESINYLFDNYSKIYFKIINSVCADSDIKEELFSECKYNIYQAAREFKFSKNVKFSSYLGNCAKWCTYNKISEVTRVKKIQNRFENEFLSTNSIRQFSDIESNIMERDDFNSFIKDIENNEDPRIEKIFKLRYFSGSGNKLMPWKDVSTELHLSIQGCINIHNSYLKKFKQKKRYDK